MTAYVVENLAREMAVAMGQPQDRWPEHVAFIKKVRASAFREATTLARHWAERNGVNSDQSWDGLVPMFRRRELGSFQDH